MEVSHYRRLNGIIKEVEPYWGLGVTGQIYQLMIHIEEAMLDLECFFLRLNASVVNLLTK